MDDDDNALLYIYPKNIDVKRDVSEYSWLKDLFSKTKEGSLNYIGIVVEGVCSMGVHTCICGEMSTSVDYLFQNGMVTNSLYLHYLESHYSEIPQSEYNKLDNLQQGVKYNPCSKCRRVKCLGKYKRCAKCRGKKLIIQKSS